MFLRFPVMCVSTTARLFLYFKSELAQALVFATTHTLSWLALLWLSRSENPPTPQPLQALGDDGEVQN